MICAALHDVVVQLLAAQVEEAVLEPDFLRIFLIAEHRHRQFAGRPQHLDLGDEDLDLRRSAGRDSRCRPGARRTLPSIRTTHSARSVSAILKAGLSGSATTCVRP